MKRLRFERFAQMEYSGTEALNTLCTNLSFSGSDMRKIVMTSSHEGEGKSLVTMQAMRTMAKLGKSVVVVDADLRRSVLVSRYGIASDEEKLVGLAHYLAGYYDMEDIIYDTDIEGASFVPIGRDVANPLPLLNASQFPRLLDYLASQYDMVLVDAPPIGLVVDAVQVAKHCDGILLVVEYNNVRRRELQDVRRQMEQSGKPILGCVLNNVAFDTYSAKRYYNTKGYYYSHYTKEYKR